MKNSIQMIKECIAREEPCFVLRGKDRCALEAIAAYYEEVKKTVKDAAFIEEIEEITKDFWAYARERETHVPD